MSDSGKIFKELRENMEAHPMQALFNDLTRVDEGSFRKWARENYVLNGPINNTWHPVVRHEVCKMMMEKLTENMEECKKVMKLLEAQINGKS